MQKEKLFHDEDEHPLLPVGSTRSRNTIQGFLPTRWRRMAHIAEGGLAVLLVASILIAWFAIGQRLRPFPRQATTSAAQHQPAILFTYQSPAIYPAFWVAGGEHLAFIRNGAYIAIWDTATKKLSPTVITLPAADNEGGGNIGLSLDGTRFVSSIYDITHQQGQVQVWDTITGRTILTYSAPLQHQSSGMTIALSADSKYLAVAGYDNRIRIWDIVTGKLLLTCEPSSVSLRNLPMTNLSWSPNGKRIFALTEQGTVQIWDAATGHKLITYQYAKARLLTGSPDGQRLLSENRDGTLSVFDSITHHVLWSTSHSTTVTEARWTLDGTAIIGYGISNLLVLNGTKGTPILAIPLSSEGVSTAFSPDDRRLLSIQGGKIIVWDVHTGRKLLTYATHVHAGDALAWSPDGKRIALGSSDGVAQIWNAATGMSLYTYKYTGNPSNGSAFVDSIIWSPSSNFIAVIHGVPYAHGQEQEIQILRAS